LLPGAGERLLAAAGLNQRWSMDFMSDQLADGNSDKHYPRDSSDYH